MGLVIIFFRQVNDNLLIYECMIPTIRYTLFSFPLFVSYIRNVPVTSLSLYFSQERSVVILTTAAGGGSLSLESPLNKWRTENLLNLKHLRSTRSLKESTTLPHHTGQRNVSVRVLECMTSSQCFLAALSLSPSERHFCTWLTATFVFTTTKHHG